MSSVQVPASTPSTPGPNSTRTNDSKTQRAVNRLVVILIKPTTYDDNGYPLCHFVGVLPSNTLATMHSETRRSFEHARINGHIDPNIQLEVVIRDETIAQHVVICPEQLMAQHLDDHTTILVGMVGVQTNQWNRAAELALRFKEAGAEVIIGGFHVSGSISAMKKGLRDVHKQALPCPNLMPPEIAELIKKGIMIFHGECEENWWQVLRDVITGKTLEIYYGGQPHLENHQPADYPQGYFDPFAYELQTITTSRGCIFACSFCTIIQVQGRTMRFYQPAAVIRWVKRQCDKNGQANFFITDDNFARNPAWKEILAGFIALQETGHRFSFMIEADLASYKQKDFISMLARAGCAQIFLGVESLNEATLATAQKHQNKPEHYHALVSELRRYGIAAHAGFIIGFPDDTPTTIAASVKKLKEIGFSQVSFFILTPLPGSQDHLELFLKKVWMHPDYNLYDSAHPTTVHPNMADTEWMRSYRRAWRGFYTPLHMLRTLRALPYHRRGAQLRNYLWYFNAFALEGTHPMMTGFWSIRHRHARRSNLPLEKAVVFYSKCVLNKTVYLTKAITMLLPLFFLLWIATKLISEQKHESPSRT